MHALVDWIAKLACSLVDQAHCIGVRKGGRGRGSPTFSGFYYCAPHPHLYTKLKVRPPHFEFTSSAYDCNSEPINFVHSSVHSRGPLGSSEPREPPPPLDLFVNSHGQYSS